MTNTNSLLIWLAQNKDPIAAIQSIVTVLGILIGGFWAYLLFIRQRQKQPRAKLEHKVHSWAVSDLERFVRVSLQIHNEGEVVIKVLSLKTGLQQIRPWSLPISNLNLSSKEPLSKNNSEFDFAYLKQQRVEFEKVERPIIEPHESDEIHVDFVIPASVQTLAVYSFVPNPSWRPRFGHSNGKPTEKGWRLTSIHELGGDANKVQRT